MGEIRATTSTATSPQHQQLVKQAKTWVSQTFFGTLLKQMRKSPFKSELFSGGRGGDVFADLYDQRLTERMSRGAGSKLVHAIVNKVESAAKYRTLQTTKNK